MQAICSSCGNLAVGGSCPRCAGVRTEPAQSGFVGRAGELRALHAALNRALAGEGAIALIVGEPGIGKTRLVEELVAEAHRRDARVLRAGRHEDDGAPAYWSWIQIIRAYAREVSGEALTADLGAGAADIAQLVAEVRALLPDLSTPITSDPAGDRFRLFEAVAAFLAAAARRRPMVIVLEDLHWADPAMLALLRHISRDLHGTRLLLLVTYRDVDPEPGKPLADALLDLLRHRHTERIHLRGLDIRETERLVGALLTDAGLGDDGTIASAVQRESEGNPLFIEELVRGLIEARRPGAVAGSGTAIVDTIALPALPQSVEQVIGRRLARLSESCRVILAQAAVVGREFAYDLLARMVGADAGTEDPAEASGPALFTAEPEDRPATALDVMSDQGLGVVADTTAVPAPASNKTANAGQRLLSAIEEGVAARVLVEDRDHAEPVYAFSHALIQRVLYDGISAARRRQLHLRAAEAIESFRAADPARQAATLALHYRLAGSLAPSDRAVEYAERAAVGAMAVHAHEEAARLYALALAGLELHGRPDPRRQCELLVALGDAYFGMGAFPRMVETLERAVALGTAISAPELVARAVIRLEHEGIFWLRADDQRIQRIEQALTLFGDREGGSRAALMAHLAAALAHHPRRRTESGLIAERAVAIARRSGDAALLAEVLIRVWNVPLETSQRHAIAAEAVQVAQAGRLPSQELQARMWAVHAYLEGGDLVGLEHEMDLIDLIVARVRSPLWRFFTTLPRVDLLLIKGRYDDAERLVEQLRGDSRRFQNANTSGQLGELRFCLDRERGRLAGMITGLERAAGHNRNILVQSMLTFAYADLGRIEQARRSFDDLATDGFAQVRADRFWHAATAMLTEVCVVLADQSAAEPLYRLLLPLAGTNLIHGDCMFFGAADRHLGMLAALLGRWPEAERHFTDALAINERQGARAWAAWTRHDHARMLLARRATGDHSSARAMLDHALTEARALGMARLEAAVAALTHSAGTASAFVTAPAAPYGLTERELTVLRHIAAGRSNHEIASALFLSVRTIERHAENVYGKLGVRGRSEAIALAVRDGLAPD